MWVTICLYWSNSTKFGQLILRKIIKIVATRCQILSLKCTKIDFGWGSAPDPAGGAFSAPSDPLAGFGGPISKERGGERRGRGREGNGRGFSLPKVNFLVTSLNMNIMQLNLWHIEKENTIIKNYITVISTIPICFQTIQQISRIGLWDWARTWTWSNRKFLLDTTDK